MIKNDIVNSKRVDIKWSLIIESYNYNQASMCRV